MKVSIITVVYNNKETIRDAVESVLGQSLKDIEYIVIDGDSKDGTKEILYEYESRISKIVSEPDNGLYDAINKGIKLATGDIVGILNSDDFFADANVLTRVVQAFENDQTLDAVYADVVFVNGSDPTKITRYYSSKNFTPKKFKLGFQPAHPTFYAKRGMFERYGVYRTDLRIAGDFELLLRFILVHKVRFKYINDVWVKMRTGGLSTSGIKSVLKLNKEISIACKLNDVYTNKLFIYSKYLVKWISFIRK